MKKIRLAITMGDPAGIGPELIEKLSTDETVYQLCEPTFIGNRSFLKNEIESLIDLPTRNDHTIKHGKLNKASGFASNAYLFKAAQLIKANAVDAIVTGPINKETLKLAKLDYLDHTDFLTKYFTGRPITLIAAGNLRVAHVMRHCSLAEAINKLSPDMVYKCILRTHNSLLKYFNSKNISILVAGLNPHNSDNGLFGKEEETIIGPAIERAKDNNINVIGPIAADSVFPLAIEQNATCVIAMYHDQGHIAVKAHNWKNSYGITLGLDILRTSVDHGTAYNIAGKGIADISSFIAAIKAAVKFKNLENENLKGANSCM